MCRFVKPICRKKLTELWNYNVIDWLCELYVSWMYSTFSFESLSKYLHNSKFSVRHIVMDINWDNLLASV